MFPPYTYIVGLRLSSINDADPGKPHLDFFLEITDDDYRKMMAEELNNRISDQPTDTPTSDKFSSTYSHLRLRSSYNSIAMLKFTSEHRWSRELMELHIKNTKLEKLLEARI